MSQDMDISWQVLRGIVEQWTDGAAELAEVKPLAGGCINTTLLLTTNGGDRSVLKISPHRVNREYADEAHQLELLRNAGVPTPHVFAAHTATLDHPNSYLLMEYVEGVTLSEARRLCDATKFDNLQAHLARLLLTIHERTGVDYCRVSAEQSQGYASWPHFYQEVFDPIWERAEKDKSMPVKTRRQIGRIHERLERYIAHEDQPRLVHWDIWGTNVLCAPDSHGNWRVTALLDPNCKFAHVEAEIAYMELFHTVTPGFFKAYQQSRRLPTEYYRIRRPIYQMYSLLNHFALFGQEYVKPLTQTLSKLNAVM
jgi:protein-ribulosamine 3-kinase